jgi:uncharacterized membrane protein YdbT with pleckstrin-like domain
MDENTATQYFNFLRQIFLFGSLNDEQLDDLLGRLELVEYTENQIVFNQGDAAEYFYVVYQGRVKITRSDPIEEKLWGMFGSGEYFGEQALLLKQPRSATAVAVDSAILFQISLEVFRLLIDNYPVVRADLIAVIGSRELSRRVKFEWLGKEEVIYLISQKHEFFLYRSLILPILVGLLAIPVFIFGNGISSSFFHTISLLGSAFMLAMAVLWSIWNRLDWGNDYYLVTNQRVLWIERVIGLYNSRREAPLTTILAVNVTSSQVGRILKYGNVDVRTFTGSIFMRNMARPNLFASFVKGHQFIAQQHMKEAELKDMQVALKQSLGINQSDTVQTVHKPLQRISTQKPSPKPQTVSLKERMQTFFKVRYEKGGVVTYRKHYLILLSKIGSASLAFLGLLAFSIFVIWQSFSGNSFIFSLGAWIILLLPMFTIVVLWWGYQYLDWSNDIYRLTPDQILDIEKKPLGSEDKKTAPLDSILSIEHARNGIIELLFNYGDVTINVGETKFLFHGVYNPDQVHQDVADYMESRKRRKRSVEAKSEQERMVNWFKTYYQQTETQENDKNEAGEENISG